MEVNDITHRIIGCAMKVHNALGNGFPEIIYQRVLTIEMTNNGLVFEQEKDMHILYEGQKIGSRRVDLFVENCIMLEIKAFEKIEEIHKNQAINYLEVYNIADGLLINFGGLALILKEFTIKN